LVVAMLLSGDIRGIVEAIRGHDHTRMPWLPEAARLSGDKEARSAIQECARSAPDEVCRNSCAKALTKE
jgi:hypothetical protein